jgi:hypothetical protein
MFDSYKDNITAQELWFFIAGNNNPERVSDDQRLMLHILRLLVLQELEIAALKEQMSVKSKTLEALEAKHRVFGPGTNDYGRKETSYVGNTEVLRKAWEEYCKANLIADQVDKTPRTINSILGLEESQ